MEKKKRKKRTNARIKQMSKCLWPVKLGKAYMGNSTENTIIFCVLFLCRHRTRTRYQSLVFS